MNQKSNKRPLLEESLIIAMRAIDNQIAREMQRDPKELERHGVQKWEPYEKRVELITALVLDAIGDQEVQLDSLLVMAQSFAKALHLYCEDIGKGDLGKLRTTYCQNAFKNIEQDAVRGEKTLKGEIEVN